MKNIFLYLALVCLCSCSTKENHQQEETSLATKNKKEEKKFEMYEMSEMAALMEQMYVDNLRLKERIEKGEEVGEFPSHFTKIHSSIMTDPTDKDSFFDEQAQLFLKAQELIYKEPEKAKEHYNNAVQACISCHEVKCTGPIVRIKKLQLH